jgi:predicted regulator of Ras-like GTPase activity (Roadblock/LC7/MglB family)
MEFTQLFSILSVLGALLFFSAGFALALLKGGRWRESAEPESVYDSETALREAIDRAEALDAEGLRLRSEVGVATAEIARLTMIITELERRNAVAPSVLPPAAIDATTGGMTFQGILGRLGKTKGMRAAVLGDALGLPVAAFGEQSESLAGYCGFISQAASKARDFLQLGSIRRIVIEDERLATLTACSIGGTDIFLATLTSGPGPDFARMIQVLNDVKSFISKRSRP